jgi:hypothetical protein
MNKMNAAYIAHIVSDSENGPRGDRIRSPKLAKDLNNLMLLCDEHHRKIDIEEKENHSESVLTEMKKEHESRISFLTALKPNNKVHIVVYGANIGIQGSPLDYQDIVHAVLPNKYPANEYPIELGISNSSFQDNEEIFWNVEIKNLERQFQEKVEKIKNQDAVKCFALFGLAPQPLLIKIGTLFSDLYDVDVFQKHREPSTWIWQDNFDFEGYTIEKPTELDGIPVLNLSLSANITDDRIEKLFNSKTSIWKITHKNPNNDFLKSRDMLAKFRKTLRSFFDQVKFIHGQNAKLHVFPAMPVSAAVELGRIWMPKADVKMIIYDQNKKKQGFYKTIEII